MSIKAKIIAGASLVIILSTIGSGIFAYQYFTRILKEQVIEDDSIKLNQIGQQIDYITEDIKKFSYNIIIDRQVQDFLKNTYYEDTFDEVISIDNAVKQLSRYIQLRDYI